MSHYQVPTLRRLRETEDKGVDPKKKIHAPLPLLYNWTMWYHSPESNSWSLDSYQKIMTIKTIEEFWSFYDLIKETFLSTGMFFLMRDGIMPTWEDSQNIKGGCWSFKVSRKDTYHAWLELSIALVGNTLVQCQSPMLIDLITGISISPKKGFCIIKIWNKDCQFSDPKLLKADIPGLVLEDSIYKAFTPENE